MRQLTHLLPKNWVVKSLPYFRHGSLGMTPKTLKFCRLVSEKFLETETIIFFPGPPLQGGQDAKILFLSTQRPRLQKN